MWHTEAHLEDIQGLEVTPKETGRSTGQVGFQGVLVGVRYKRYLKEEKPEHTGTAGVQLPQQVFSTSYSAHRVKFSTRDET